ncbi:MAG TPA: PaaI family thioesterase [Thermoanaerobaculia bacterium]|nr:PaaI family thioesterase [Thermoanaerobaculia bacterium]
MSETFASVPFNQALAFELVSASGGSAEVRLPLQPWFEQEVSVVHGGIIASLADTTAVYAVMPQLGQNRTMTGVEFKMNFIRAATMSGGPLIAKSRTVRLGNTIAVCAVDVSQRDRLVATGIFTFLVRSSR